MALSSPFRWLRAWFLDLSSRRKVSGGPHPTTVLGVARPAFPRSASWAHLRYSLRWPGGSLGGCGPPALALTSPVGRLRAMVPLRAVADEGLERSRGGPPPLAVDLSVNYSGYWRIRRSLEGGYPESLLQESPPCERSGFSIG